MRLIRQERLTTSEALKLEHLGFILKLVCMSLFGKDRYNVYVK